MLTDSQSTHPHPFLLTLSDSGQCKPIDSQINISYVGGRAIKQAPPSLCLCLSLSCVGEFRHSDPVHVVCPSSHTLEYSYTTSRRQQTSGKDKHCTPRPHVSSLLQCAVSVSKLALQLQLPIQLEQSTYHTI